MLKKRFPWVVALVFCLIVSLFMVVNTGRSPPPDEEEDDRDGGPWALIGVPLFPEILILRGTTYLLHYYVNYTDGPYPEQCNYDYWRILVDQDMPYPPEDVHNSSNLISRYPFPTSWTWSQETRFIHEAYAQRDYYIQGDVVVGFLLYYWVRNPAKVPDTVYFNVTLRFEKLQVDGVPVALDSDTATIVQRVEADTTVMRTLYSYPMGFTFKFPSPVTINAGERLSLTFVATARCNEGHIDGLLDVQHHRGSDEFVAHVPIAHD